VVLGVSPISGVARLPLTAALRVTVAVPPRGLPAGQAPVTRSGPPMKVIHSPRALVPMNSRTINTAPKMCDVRILASGKKCRQPFLRGCSACAKKRIRGVQSYDTGDAGGVNCGGTSAPTLGENFLMLLSFSSTNYGLKRLGRA